MALKLHSMNLQEIYPDSLFEDFVPIQPDQAPQMLFKACCPEVIIIQITGILGP